MVDSVRFQLGRSDVEERSGLLEHRQQLKGDLVRSIRAANGPGEMRLQVGTDPGVVAPTVEQGADQMLELAGQVTETTRIRTIPDEGSGRPSVHLWVLFGEIHDISVQVPGSALENNGDAIRAMLAFHEELTFVFPEYKTLGGYVPRPIRKQIPPGWVSGDPWPFFEGELAFASEHAWGDAVDSGKSNGMGGFDEGPTLKPLLRRIADYTLANRGRTALVDLIFDRHRFHARDDFAQTDYTGSDPHDTHTHAAFGEHGGVKPSWL